MNERTEEYKSSEDLRREIADLKIQLAFQEQFEEEVEEILKECEDPDPELMNIVRKEEQGLLNEIDQQFRKSSFRAGKFLRFTTGKVAAIVVVLMVVSISSAMAAIQMVRAGVFALDIVGDGRRMSVRMIQTEDTDVPDEWQGDYYPTYIPNGFEFAYVDGTGAYYLEHGGKWMVFEERSYGTRTSIDTENATISSAQINGAEAMVVEKEDVSIVLWSMRDRYFVVSIVDKKEAAIQIAASVILNK